MHKRMAIPAIVAAVFAFSAEVALAQQRTTTTRTTTSTAPTTRTATGTKPNANEPCPPGIAKQNRCPEWRKKHQKH